MHIPPLVAKHTQVVRRTVQENTQPDEPRRRVCIHALQPVRKDIRAQRIAMALAQSGFAVSIVDIAHGASVSREETFSDIAAKNLLPPEAELVAESPVRHIIMPERLARYYDPTNYIRWLLFKGWRMLCSVFRLLRTRAEVYHASDIMALPACYIAARIHRKLLVFDAYELPLAGPHYVQSAPLRLLNNVFASLLRALLPHCSGIMTVSPPLRRELQRHFGGKQAVLVRNIPVYRAPRPSNHLRRYLGLDDETRIALYQGYLQPGRGLDGLVQAAKYLDHDIVIVMLGKGDSQATLDSLIAQEGVRDRVRLVPAVPYAELLDWTASADIGLIVSRPTYSTNVEVLLPNKLFEYLMAGLPVLTSPLEAVVDVIRTYDVGRVLTSLEPAELGRAISELLADRVALERMRHNALAAAKAVLRWDVEQEKLLELYDHIFATQKNADAEAEEHTTCTQHHAQ